MRCRVIQPAEVDPILDAGAIVEVIDGADYQRLMDVLAEHAADFDRIPEEYIPVRYIEGTILAPAKTVKRSEERLGYFGYLQNVFGLEGLDWRARNFIAGKAGDQGD